METLNTKVTVRLHVTAADGDQTAEIFDVSATYDTGGNPYTMAGNALDAVCGDFTVGWYDSRAAEAWDKTGRGRVVLELAFITDELDDVLPREASWPVDVDTTGTLRRALRQAAYAAKDDAQVWKTQLQFAAKGIRRG